MTWEVICMQFNGVPVPVLGLLQLSYLISTVEMADCIVRCTSPWRECTSKVHSWCSHVRVCVRVCIRREISEWWVISLMARSMSYKLWRYTISPCMMIMIPYWSTADDAILFQYKGHCRRSSVCSTPAVSESNLILLHSVDPSEYSTASREL